MRNTYAGLSNQLGLTAWDLAESGFLPERDGIGTVYGGILAEDFSADAMVVDLGTRWEIARNYFKRHAACRYTHGALDALAQIRAESGPIDPDAVRSVEVATYVWAAQLDHPAPETMLAAKFSCPSPSRRPWCGGRPTPTPSGTRRGPTAASCRSPAG